MNAIDPVTTVDVGTVPPIDHLGWTALAATEVDRGLDLLRSLDEDEWRAPTACEPWDVRTLVSHMVAMVEQLASTREFLRVGRAATKAQKAGAGIWIDAMTAIQVAERATATPADLVADLARLGPASIRHRRRMPALARRFLGITDDGAYAGERLRLGYIVDVLSTRDAWTHRFDVCLAVGRQPVVTSDHDGRIVADAVAEWARRHGEPFRLVLTGPAGGAWHHGADGPRLELDAIEFCRILSGRGEGDGLLATPVLF